MVTTPTYTSAGEPFLPPVNVVAPSTWKPTKKWRAAAITGLAAVLAQAAGSGEWGSSENSALLTLGVSLALAYLRSNDPTPGGVPVKDREPLSLQ